MDQALSVCDPGKLARHAGSLLQLAEALECPDFVFVSTLFSFVFFEFRFSFVKRCERNQFCCCCPVEFLDWKEQEHLPVHCSLQQKHSPVIDTFDFDCSFTKVISNLILNLIIILSKQAAAVLW